MRTLTPIHCMACSGHSRQEQGGHGQALFKVSHLCGVDQAFRISVLLSGHPRQAAAPRLCRSIEAHKGFHRDGSADCEVKGISGTRSLRAGEKRPDTAVPIRLC